METDHGAFTTLDILLQRYGPLISYSQLAEIFHRSPQGLRLTIRSGSTEFALRLRRAKRRYGRLVRFNTVEVSKLIDGEGDQA